MLLVIPLRQEFLFLSFQRTKVCTNALMNRRFVET